MSKKFSQGGFPPIKPIGFSIENETTEEDKPKPREYGNKRIMSISDILKMKTTKPVIDISNISSDTAVNSDTITSVEVSSYKAPARAKDVANNFLHLINDLKVNKVKRLASRKTSKNKKPSKKKSR